MCVIITRLGTRFDTNVGIIRQLQVGTAATGGADHYSGMVDCIRKIVKNEGYARSNIQVTQAWINLTPNAGSVGCTVEYQRQFLWKLPRGTAINSSAHCWTHKCSSDDFSSTGRLSLLQMTTGESSTRVSLECQP